ncbi:hypothetical protein SAMN05216198_3350 [Halopseudomonas litoralis]|uniref:Uncharacterized protein n=1 Tax=Halopseudomonas litoralis TaxID=797277 RepID=A0A1H1WPQ4_9GAMM|nr:hypothetical protein SAMN05216198_3350 [Halopseudomonas litoralis]
MNDPTRADAILWTTSDETQCSLHEQKNNRTRLFPVPDPKVELTDAARKTEPDFKRTNRLLWADQETPAGDTGTFLHFSGLKGAAAPSVQIASNFAYATINHLLPSSSKFT